MPDAPPQPDPRSSGTSSSLAGSTRYYGIYYRDANAGFCPNPPGNTWNIGNGFQLTWSN